MSRSSTPLRARTGAKNLDLTALRDALKDRRQWTALAVVSKPEDGSPHWYVEEGRGGDKRMIMVEVVTVPEGIELTCRLGTCSMGEGTGVWMIPREGSIVSVNLADGQLDHCPVITAVLDSGAAPERVSDERAVIVADVPIEVSAPDVLVGQYDGSGTVHLGGAAAEEFIVLGNIKSALDKLLVKLGEYGGATSPSGSVTGIGPIADPVILTNPELSAWGSILMPAILEFIATFCTSRNVKST